MEIEMQTANLIDANIIIVPIGSDCGFTNGKGKVYVTADISKEVKNGDAGAFELNGEFVFKYYEQTNGVITLTEPNKKPITVTETDDFTVIGKARHYHVKL